jgi:hypothetical protein
MKGTHAVGVVVWARDVLAISSQKFAGVRDRELSAAQRERQVLGEVT